MARAQEKMWGDSPAQFRHRSALVAGTLLFVIFAPTLVRVATESIS
jgi:hypothetical protein